MDSIEIIEFYGFLLFLLQGSERFAAVCRCRKKDVTLCADISNLVYIYILYSEILCARIWIVGG